MTIYPSNAGYVPANFLHFASPCSPGMYVTLSPSTVLVPMDGLLTLTNVNGCPSGSTSLVNGYTSTGVSSSVSFVSGRAIGFARKHCTVIVTVASVADTN